jgi:sugar phosphate isomerase/epimerase
MYAGFGFHVPFEQRLNQIYDAGFHSTSIWWEADREPIKTLKHTVPKIIRDIGLHLDHIHVPYRHCAHLWSDDFEKRDTMLKRHLEWLQDCNRHSIPAMVMHCTQGSGTPPPNQCGLDVFNTMVEKAEEFGVKIAVENMRHSEHLDYLFDAIDSPHLGLCYDASHDWLYHDKPGAVLHTWGHRVVTTHLADTNGKRDLHWLPGKGIVNFQQVRAILCEKGYQGTYMLEVTTRDKESRLEPFIQDALESLTQTMYSEEASPT